MKIGRESGSARPLHLGHRRPLWGTGDLGGGVGVARLATLTPNRPRTPTRRSPVDSGSGPPIGDPDTSTEVADVLCGHRRPRWRGRGRQLPASTPNRPRTPSRSPRWIRGRGRQSATPTLPPRSPVPTEVTGDQDGGVGLIPIPFRFSSLD
ncbi:hypothetical protein CDL15_Pgr026635 [Punica granatum]|uniref:Uncharacterized protein n=1 Tax=Punica granatum TaxID=22663 RepID=A0A218WLM9_PUNGR|nr:hypothetical protein CDL15_Pgr026635 [Punica granatum]PKI77193.1 hypothetical protein CRG98_002403 [Punica granatum]